MRLFILSLLALFSTNSQAVETGAIAPAFTLKGAISNKEINLADTKGKVVVLEWLNHGCPFVRKHYDTQNMQNLQKKYADKGVIWFSIVSSAPGKQGYVDGAGAVSEAKENNSKATDILLDPEGKVGQLYEAKVTPHMYVINKEGKLVYQGAIDDQPSTDKDSVRPAKNFVSKALDEVLANKKVSMASSKAYGCGVKY